MNKDFDSPIRDQGACGSCTRFGTIAVIENCMRANLDTIVDLSEQDLHQCAPGSCARGAYVDETIEACKKGVALENDVPYKARDMPCGSGRPSDWWTRGKKILGFETIIGLDAVKSELMKRPLVGSFAVHQSFMNYKSGVYHNLGIQDPIVGYHCVEWVDYDESKDAILGKNSWGTGWGMEGYFWIKAAEIDHVAYAVTPCNDPLPDPGPNPQPKKWWEVLLEWIVNIFRRFGIEMSENTDWFKLASYAVGALLILAGFALVSLGRVEDGMKVIAAGLIVLGVTKVDLVRKTIAWFRK